MIFLASYLVLTPNSFYHNFKNHYNSTSSSQALNGMALRAMHRLWKRGGITNKLFTKQNRTEHTPEKKVSNELYKG